ncbi:uncharacterized protein BO97DRAFT_472925 [Aspergillus homomorphus CBS 101889]|uniref:Myb-like domain-containing protein n=1 Tax=Aspergillus homomorphus (strain CBS 101889) TaxID=1450537 RepID=A0A395HL18_ASPHC|nr:hypothetical protein BO97DRAFT_472925 [Aspergillus homomorphus CBS 101889]RAL08547.1 hypothetical protein BO97DRAFT_472925 [Aspergillus homomorphus CBS 101889]
MSNSIDDDPSDPVSTTDENNTLAASLLGTTDDAKPYAGPSGVTHLQLSLSRDSVDSYADVLRRLTDDNAPVPEDFDTEKHKSTQNGVVFWSPQEKEVLYRVLDKKGKEGIRDAVRALGSKSEIEVQEHLRLLHRGLQRQHLKEGHSRTIILADVPAAAEISEECNTTLENYAELLRLEEQQHEDVVGRQKHHNFWVIDQATATELDYRAKLKPQDAGHDHRSSVHLTASLFRMKNWVHLSERFFMNFGGTRLEDNWQTSSFRDESPSLTADAFADFYALAVSATRRLVQSSLFFAESRLRKMRDAGHERALEVKSRDVRTALDVLGMKRNGAEFWIGMARRLSLDVVDSRHMKDWKPIQMDYDEVEDILSGKLPLPSQTESVARSISRGRQKTDGQEMTADDEFESSLSDEDEPIDYEDQYAGYVDQEASHAEETNLRRLIGRSAHTTESERDNEEEAAQNAPRVKLERLKRPIGERKATDDLVDWRDRLLFRSEWEEYGQEVLDLQDEISENRRKRRPGHHIDMMPVNMHYHNSTTDTDKKNQGNITSNGIDKHTKTSKTKKTRAERDLNA